MVAQMLEFIRQTGVGVSEMLSMARLVEESLIVILAALRLDNKNNFFWNAERHAEGARNFLRALFNVNYNVFLVVNIKAKAFPEIFRDADKLFLLEKRVKGLCCG